MRKIVLFLLFLPLSIQGQSPCVQFLTPTTVTTSSTITPSYNMQLIRVNSANNTTQTLPASPVQGEIVYIKNVGTGNVTVSGGTIDGQSSAVIYAGTTQATLCVAYDTVSNTWNVL